MIMALRQFRVMQEVRGDLLIGDKLWGVLSRWLMSCLVTLNSYPTQSRVLPFDNIWQCTTFQPLVSRPRRCQ
jgi:hypothetical protein